MSAGRTVGIDLGTSTTVAAVDRNVVSFSAQGGAILPSVVAYPPSGGVLVGVSARRRRPIDPKNTIVSAKRLIGRRFSSEDAVRFRELYPMDLVATPDGNAAFQTRAGVITPTQVSSILLSSLYRQLAAEPGPLRAVIAVPVVFQAPQREATLEAARQAGFDQATLIDEPRATPLAHLQGRSERPRYVATYDFGGGTFDFAVLDCRREPYEVLGFGGDLYLGGDDIDQALAAWAADEVLRSHRWDLRVDPAVYARLVVECERAKIRLCSQEETRIDLSQVDPASPEGAEGPAVSRRVLAELCLDLVRRTFVICDEVLARCRLKASDLDAVYYAGGTTKLPMIRDGIEQYFGQAPRCDFDPMQVVSIGASLA